MNLSFFPERGLPFPYCPRLPKILQPQLGYKNGSVDTYLCSVYCSVVNNLNTLIGCQLWSRFKAGKFQRNPTGSKPSHPLKTTILLRFSLAEEILPG